MLPSLPNQASIVGRHPVFEGLRTKLTTKSSELEGVYRNLNNFVVTFFITMQEAMEVIKASEDFD